MFSNTLSDGMLMSLYATLFDVVTSLDASVNVNVALHRQLIDDCAPPKGTVQMVDIEDNNDGFVMAFE